MHIREWRPDEYTAIESRGLVLSYAAILAHRGNVWFAVDPVTDSEYVVKALEKGDRELFILPWLLDHPALRNVVLPAEIITCEKSCLIIMPRLIPGTDLLFASHTPKHMTVMLHGFAGLIECVEVLHRNNIAHMDIDNENFVYADRDISFGSHFIKKGSVYLIDFGATRRFDSGPGTNVIIHDYKEAGGHYRPPEGKDAVDPYAYDIYSIGVNLKLCWEVVEMKHRKTDIELPTSGVMAFILGRLMCNDPHERARIEDAKLEWERLMQSLHQLPNFVW